MCLDLVQDEPLVCCKDAQAQPLPDREPKERAINKSGELGHRTD